MNARNKASASRTASRARSSSVTSVVTPRTVSTAPSGANSGTRWHCLRRRPSGTGKAKPNSSPAPDANTRPQRSSNKATRSAGKPSWAAVRPRMSALARPKSSATRSLTYTKRSLGSIRKTAAGRLRARTSRSTGGTEWGTGRAPGGERAKRPRAFLGTGRSGWHRTGNALDSVASNRHSASRRRTRFSRVPRATPTVPDPPSTSLTAVSRMAPAHERSSEVRESRGPILDCLHPRHTPLSWEVVQGILGEAGEDFWRAYKFAPDQQAVSCGGRIPRRGRRSV